MYRDMIITLAVCCINLAAFAVFGRDKALAKSGKWRIPEWKLLVLCLLGGAAGGLAGMLFFRHKTKKPLFYLGVPLLFLLETATLAAYYLKKTSLFS